jgi:hypothetical protein
MAGLGEAFLRHRCKPAGPKSVNARALKALILLLVALVAPVRTYSQDSLRIETVGLGGYYSGVVPVPVQIHVSAYSRPVSLRLEFTVRSGYSYGARGIVRTDHFFKSVSLPAGQASDVEVPVLIPQTPTGALDVMARSLDGRAVGSASQDFKTLQSLSQSQYLVAVYCQDDATCVSAESQIAFHGKGVPGTDQRVTSFRAPRQHWWSYSLARAVVLAGPLAGFTQDERAALEDYARTGGILVILEDEIADKNFLAPYRMGAPTLAPIRIGRGHLYRLRSVASNDLAQPSFDSTFSKFANFVGYLTGQPSAEPLLNRVGVSFTFPRLRWLILWLSAYLLVVGPLNFFLVRRAKRLEWGWLTTCLLALVFAASFYFASSAGRPRNYTLDNATVYWMDSRSPVAVEDVGLRISSPRRGDVAVSVDDDVVAINPGNAWPSGPSDVELGAEMTEKQRIQQGSNVDLGPPVTAVTAMLRWSTQDFQFEGFRKLDGTVHWISKNKLRNNSGISFREAIYVDFAENRQYLIPHVGPGEEIDLAALPSDLIWARKDPGIGFGVLPSPAFVVGAGRMPFSIDQFSYSGFQIESGSHIFAGLSDEPLPSTQLKIPVLPRAKVVLTIVDMDEK